MLATNRIIIINIHMELEGMELTKVDPEAPMTIISRSGVEETKAAGARVTCHSDKPSFPVPTDL